MQRRTSAVCAIFFGLIMLGILLTYPQPLLAGQDNGIVTTDYLVSHKSIEPFYKQYNLDPHVVIHVREVVLAGGERTASKKGKVVLMIHGASVPAVATFDLDCNNCSIMRYLARAGWDTFAMDIEGYGQSTRPLIMDAPSAFPESKAPIHTEVAVNDVERVVDFISNLRGVAQVYLLGNSLGASRTAPIYTMRHPEKVVKLVLVAPGYRSLGWVEKFRTQAVIDGLENKRKVRYTRPSLQGALRYGNKPEFMIPGSFEMARDARLASDPKSGELGGRHRSPAGRVVDLLRSNPQYDASQITVPTLVIRGDHDTFSTQEDAKKLTEELGSEVKRYVEIPNAGHGMQRTHSSVQFFKAIKDFLEAKVKKNTQ